MPTEDINEATEVYTRRQLAGGYLTAAERHHMHSLQQERLRRGYGVRHACFCEECVECRRQMALWPE